MSPELPRRPHLNVPTCEDESLVKGAAALKTRNRMLTNQRRNLLITLDTVERTLAEDKALQDTILREKENRRGNRTSVGD